MPAQPLVMSYFVGIYSYCYHVNFIFVLILVEDAKKRWKNLTDSFKKCLDREREQMKSGAGAMKTPTCRLYKELYFLRDIISKRTTTSNLSIQQYSSPEPSWPASPQVAENFESSVESYCTFIIMHSLSTS